MKLNFIFQLYLNTIIFAGYFIHQVYLWDTLIKVGPKMRFLGYDLRNCHSIFKLITRIFLFLQVFSEKLSIQTRYCILHYDYKVATRQWYHICVTADDTITTYVNGQLVNSDSNCFFNGSRIITSAIGHATLGSNPFMMLPIDGHLADVRIYPSSLTHEQVQDIAKFTDSDSNYVSAITNVKHGLPQGTEKKIIKKSELSMQNYDSKWLYIAEKQTYEDAKATCSIFGGSILKDTDVSSIDQFIDYMENDLEAFIIEVWNSNDGTCMSSSVSMVNVVTRNLECTEKISFICNIPDSTTFSLMGDDLPRTPLVLIPEEFSFNTETIMKIVVESNTLIIKNAFTNTIMAHLLDYVPPSEVLGRKRDWKFIGGDSPAMSLTITTCSDNQFTCDNGQCIDIFSICNYAQDCLDSSDETNCNVTESRPKFYDSVLPGSNPMKVGVEIILKKIMDVDMTDNSLTVNLKLTAKWSDTRPTFHYLHPDMRSLVLKNDASYYWQPDIVMKNVIQEHKDLFSFFMNRDSLVLEVSKQGTPSTFGSREGML